MSGAGSFLSGLANGYMGMAQLDETKKLREAMTSLPAAGGTGTANDTGTGRGVKSVVSGGDVAAAPYSGKISDRVAHAFNRFTEAGLPAHVAAGLSGNMMQESGPEIDPAAVGDSGNAYGAGQWNGPRRKAYLAYASENGVSSDDFDTQIDFLLHEGKTTEKAAWDKIMATKTPEEAARVASEAFWRPGTPHLSNRVSYAQAVYDRFSAPEETVQASATEGRGITDVIDKGKEILSRFYKKGDT